MGFIYEFYETLMWKITSDEYGEHKEKYMTINEIDEMDIFFYFDLLIYRNKKENIETIKQYDAMGL